MRQCRCGTFYDPAGACGGCGYPFSPHPPRPETPSDRKKIPLQPDDDAADRNFAVVLGVLATAWILWSASRSGQSIDDRFLFALGVGIFVAAVLQNRRVLPVTRMLRRFTAVAIVGALVLGLFALFGS